MPRLIVTANARTGLERCRNFLAARNPTAAQRAAATIGKHFALVENSPEIGRPFAHNPLLQELVVPFGDAGYVALFVQGKVADAVVILAFRHQREAGY